MIERIILETKFLNSQNYSFNQTLKTCFQRTNLHEYTSTNALLCQTKFGEFWTKIKLPLFYKLFRKSELLVRRKDCPCVSTKG